MKIHYQFTQEEIKALDSIQALWDIGEHLIAAKLFVRFVRAHPEFTKSKKFADMATGPIGKFVLTDYKGEL
jgi:hypothetical protein